MAVQSSVNLKNFPLFTSGATLKKDNVTLLQDAARATPLLRGTLMAKVAASGKWVPFTDEAAVDGSSTPRGVLVSDDVPAAALVAGDVTGAVIVVGGDIATIDGQQLVIENAKTLATVIGAGVEIRTVEDELSRIGIFVENTLDIDKFEN